MYELYLDFPFIFFIDGKENLLRWKTKMFGSLLNSVLIFAFED